MKSCDIIINRKLFETLKRESASANSLADALKRLLEECNPFVTDTDRCECGENDNGMDDDGNICEHIQAVRAIQLWQSVLSTGNRS